MNTIKMHEILKKTNLSDADAHDFVDEFISAVDERFDDKREHLATKEDLGNLKADLTKSIFIASIAQILTILGGLLGILKVMEII